MKSTELRIGNIVNYGHGRPPQVITKNDLCQGVEDRPFNPIELSSEWLKKFSADTVTENEDGSHNYWSRNNDFSVDVETHILVPKLEMLFYYRIDGGLRGRRLSVTYVHQLQNLYFALTGKEL